MRRLSCTSALVVVAVNLAVTAWGAELVKIDRTIAREPVYQKQPKYCLLVFGPQAKTRVWLVVDGDVLYVDRNGNGDLTAKGQKVAALKPSNAYAAGDVTEPGRGTKHTDLRVTRHKDGRMAISIRTESKYRQQTGSFRFAELPGKAPIVHFNGALSVRFMSAVADTGFDGISSALAEIGAKGPLKLGKEIPLPAARRRSRTVVLSAVVGTPGLGEATFATYKAREVLGQPNKRIAVQVAFPNQTARARPILVAGFLQPDG
jgi:hypothetical protein